MSRINLLPYWNFPDSKFSVYDTESGTCIEMVSKVYNAMRNLQSDYNSFVTEVNSRITTFIESTNEDIDTFEKEITRIMHDYIHSIDTKIDLQDAEIKNAVDFMKENLGDSITTLLEEMRANGEINEVVLNAFEELMVKVDNVLPVVEDLAARVEAVEKIEYVLEHDPNTENLMIVRKVGV